MEVGKWHTPITEGREQKLLMLGQVTYFSQGIALDAIVYYNNHPQPFVVAARLFSRFGYLSIPLGQNNKGKNTNT